MPRRAQIVRDSLLRQLPAAVQSVVHFYAPLLLHCDAKGPGLATFVRDSVASGTLRDGAVHLHGADQPVFERGGATYLGLRYGPAGAHDRTADDSLSYSPGVNLTRPDEVGTIAVLLQEPGEAPIGLAMTYDYAAGEEKTYDREGLQYTATGVAAPADLHDGHLFNCRPFGWYVRHVLTFTRLLTPSEIGGLLTILEAA